MYSLHHGDCLDILPTLEAQSVDAVICDPPYGTTACKWDSVIPFEPMWAALKRVIKPRGAIVLFGSQPFTSVLVVSNVKQFKHSWVWDKSQVSNPQLAKVQPLRTTEDICVFGTGKVTYNPQGLSTDVAHIVKRRGDWQKTLSANRRLGHIKKMAEHYEQTYTNYPKNILKFPTKRSGVLHATQKPIDLMEYLVKTYTNAGDTVLDFTFGSGTTGAACGNLGRRFVGIEKDAEYFALGSERIATAYAPLRMMEVA
jgi:site-specific DNA-methyltransferase (adenine-specific)